MPPDRAGKPAHRSRNHRETCHARSRKCSIRRASMPYPRPPTPSLRAPVPIRGIGRTQHGSRPTAGERGCDYGCDPMKPTGAWYSLKKRSIPQPETKNPSLATNQAARGSAAVMASAGFLKYGMFLYALPVRGQQCRVLPRHPGPDPVKLSRGGVSQDHTRGEVQSRFSRVPGVAEAPCAPSSFFCLSAFDPTHPTDSRLPNAPCFP